MKYWYFFLLVWSAGFGAFSVATHRWGFVYFQSFFAVLALLMIGKG